MTFNILFLFIIFELLFLYFLYDRLTKTLYSLLFFLFRNTYVTAGFLTFIFLPGTIVHELAHLLTAEILRVRTGEISFTPKIVTTHNNEQAVEAGHVTHTATDPLRRFLIGFAPLVWGLAVLTLLIWLFQHFWGQFTDPKQQIVLGAGIGYLLFAVSNSMFTSRKDMEGSEYFIPVVVILGIAAYAAGVRFTVTGQSLVVIEQLLTGLTKALGIVMGINALIFLVNSLLLQGLRKLFRLR